MMMMMMILKWCLRDDVQVYFPRWAEVCYSFLIFHGINKLHVYVQHGPSLRAGLHQIAPMRCQQSEGGESVC